MPQEEDAPIETNKLPRLKPQRHLPFTLKADLREQLWKHTLHRNVGTGKRRHLITAKYQRGAGTSMLLVAV